MFRRKLNKFETTSDEDLIRLMHRGEKSAFETIYERYFKKLVWFAQTQVNNQDLAKDIVQEVFLKLIEHPEKFDVNRKFSTWIYTLTINKCKQHIRNNSNRQSILNQLFKENGFSTQSHQLDNQQLIEQITTIKEALNEKEKLILNLRYEQELSIKDISEIINIPEGSVKSGIFYILKKFANQLKEFKHD